jgi:predicted transcriptional regulator
MTLQIELTPELEAKLREQAQVAGKDVAAFAREAIEETLASVDAGAQPAKLSNEQWLAEWRAFTASARPLGYIIDDSRESIYEGRGE